MSDHPLFRRTDVRSRLARTEHKNNAQARCPKRHRMSESEAKRWGWSDTVGRCDRPATAHRVHQHGSVQWEKANMPDATD